MKKFTWVILTIAAVATLMPGCTRERSRFGWSATVNGDGSAVTGGSIAVHPAAAVPTPWPVPTEQLEKGNAQKVAQQSQQAAWDPILPGLVPVPTPARAAETSTGKAWYNGFL